MTTRARQIADDIKMALRSKYAIQEINPEIIGAATGKIPEVALQVEAWDNSEPTKIIAIF